MSSTTCIWRLTGQSCSGTESVSFNGASKHALKLLNYHVIAAGDSFNDTAMLTEAHVGLLFRAPENVKRQFAQFKAVETYEELMKLVKGAMG